LFSEIILIFVLYITLQANSWTVTAQNVATEATGITAMGPKTVLLAGGSNGEGSVVLKSTDGGVTWNPTQ
jgi:hypothetical protein